MSLTGDTNYFFLLDLLKSAEAGPSRQNFLLSHMFVTLLSTNIYALMQQRDPLADKKDNGGGHQISSWGFL